MPQAETHRDVLWPVEQAPCDFCGTMDADLLLRGRDRLCGVPGEWNVVVCRRCGLARTNPRLTAEALGRAYGEEYGAHQDGGLAAAPPAGFLRWALVNCRSYPLGRRSAAPVRWLLWPWAALMLRDRKYVDYLAYEGTGRLLDFACGVGRYVARMSAAGWQAEGIDLSPNAVARGRAAGLALREGTLPGVELSAESYDVIMMWHALEHVPSPMDTLRAARELLRPGGRLAVVSPLADSLAATWFGPAWYAMGELPRHLTHFTRPTLRRHMEQAGLGVERMRSIRRPTFVRRSFAYLAEDTGKALHHRLAKSKFVARLASGLALLLGRTDEALVVARKE